LPKVLTAKASAKGDGMFGILLPDRQKQFAKVA
jgi:hypothetical protein